MVSFVTGRWPCGGSHVFDIGCGYQRSLDPMLTQQVVSGWNGNGWILLTDVMMQKVTPPRKLAFHFFFKENWQG